MKAETRKYSIKQAEFKDFDKTPQYVNLPLLIEMKGGKQVLFAGKGDTLTVLRKGDDTYILSTNFNLDYASLQLIDFDQGIESDSYTCSCYILNVAEQLPTKFWNYSENYQADILMEYMPD